MDRMALELGRRVSRRRRRWGRLRDARCDLRSSGVVTAGLGSAYSRSLSVLGGRAGALVHPSRDHVGDLLRLWRLLIVRLVEQALAIRLALTLLTFSSLVVLSSATTMSPKRTAALGSLIWSSLPW